MLCKNPEYHMTEKLLRLGGEYETLQQVEPKKWDRLIALEKEIDRIQDENPEIWVGMMVCRGRNVIRRVRKEELLHV